jgi:NTE family protein
MGNPALFPLITSTETQDLLIVQINPVERKGTPTSAKEIMNRINEITFNASLMSEMEMIALVGQLIAEGKLAPGKGMGEYRPINVHRIALSHHTNGLDADSKLNTDFAFFEKLHQTGRRATAKFLDGHFDDLGMRGTVDLEAEVRAEWA